MGQLADHWEDVYAARPSTDVSWYERDPATSIRLVRSVASGASAPVIDVGAGASMLVDRLLADGFVDVSILDISPHVLSEVRTRLRTQARHVTFVCQDVLTWEPDRHYDVWHDRAVFHFLKDPADRASYVDVAERAVGVGGALVLGTFAEDGPQQCSGLPVSRYSAATLSAAFAPSFQLTAQDRELHVTPHGVSQPFTWVVLRRVDVSSAW